MKPQAAKIAAPKSAPASETFSSLRKRRAPQAAIAKCSSRKSPAARAADGRRKSSVGG